MGCLRRGCLLAAAAAVLLAQNREPADDWNDRGLAASARGDYVEAERLLGESVRLWEAMGPRYQAHLAITMMNLAEALCGQGKWKDGASLLTTALDKSRASLGAEHIRSVSAMNFLASADLVLGELEPAAALYTKALDIERRLYPGTAELAATLMGLSSYHARLNHLDAALPPAEESLEVSLRANGEDSIDTAMAYANVAQIHAFSRRFARALPLFRKAEAIYARVLSPQHPRYALVLSQEGLVLADDGKFALADRNMTRAMDILRHCSGCQYQTAIAESNFGWLRYRERKYADADRYLSEALALQESYSAHPGSEMATTLNRLADVRRKENRIADAEQLQRRALTLQSYR